jgi:hypothetical protein
MVRVVVVCLFVCLFGYTLAAQSCFKSFSFTSENRKLNVNGIPFVLKGFEFSTFSLMSLTMFFFFNRCFLVWLRGVFIYITYHHPPIIIPLSPFPTHCPIHHSRVHSSCIPVPSFLHPPPHHPSPHPHPPILSSIVLRQPFSINRSPSNRSPSNRSPSIILHQSFSVNCSPSIVLRQIVLRQSFSVNRSPSIVPSIALCQLFSVNRYHSIVLRRSFSVNHSPSVILRQSLSINHSLSIALHQSLDSPLFTHHIDSDQCCPRTVGT